MDQITGQMTIFDFLENIKEAAFSPIEFYLKSGRLGAYQGSHTRILDSFTKDKSLKEKTDILKKEYGIYGFAGYRFTPDNSYALHGIACDSKGIEVQWYEPGKVKGEYDSLFYPYEQVAKTIETLMNEEAFNQKGKE